MVARFALALAVAVSALAGSASAAPCTTDRDCNDGNFCNGREGCAPGYRGADARGCVRLMEPPCEAPDTCDEDQDRCIDGCPDQDHDGHEPFHCGGDDCDDNDANRYPGQAEVCDAAGHDEDCNPLTYGNRDTDKDGEADARCCNRDGSDVYCGVDCNDAAAALNRGAMVCDGEGVYVCGDGPTPCGAGTKCVPQPNGTGLCMTPPAGYVVPPRFTPPQPPPIPDLTSALKRAKPLPKPGVKPQTPRPAAPKKK